MDTHTQMKEMQKGYDEQAQRFIISHKLLSFGRRRGQILPQYPSGVMAWAMHSESQDLFLDTVITQHTDWATARSIGVGYWLRNSNLVVLFFISILYCVTCQTKVATCIANAQFLKNRNPSDCALFYIALKKKSTLAGLFKTIKSPKNEKIEAFLLNDFETQRWKTAAHKNAFALMKTQNYGL